jgi:rhodanese-related sulfurtransferase
MTTKSTKKLGDKLQVISPKDLKNELEKQAVVLVDVRELSEHAGEHIPGAILVPLSSFDPQKLPEIGNKQLVLYCQSSNRSSQAGQKLLAAGLKNVMHLQGGLNAWKQLGYPVNINKNAPISLMRQVQIVAGSLVFTGTLLGAFVCPWFLLISGFVGGGLVFAGVTNTCALGMLLAKLPYNQGYG